MNAAHLCSTWIAKNGTILNYFEEYATPGMRCDDDKAQSMESFHPGRNPTVSHQQSVDQNPIMPTSERPSISSGFSIYIYIIAS